MGQAEPPVRHYIVAEYMAFEEQSDVRYECFEGEVQRG